MLCLLLTAILTLSYVEVTPISQLSCDFNSQIRDSVCDYFSDASVNLSAWKITDGGLRSTIKLDGPISSMDGSGIVFRLYVTYIKITIF